MNAIDNGLNISDIAEDDGGLIGEMKNQNTKGLNGGRAKDKNRNSETERNELFGVAMENIDKHYKSFDKLLCIHIGQIIGVYVIIGAFATHPLSDWLIIGLLIHSSVIPVLTTMAKNSPVRITLRN
ncbi:MAG: hypothetical protein MPK62_03060 [Alphaproteobacteria bacterium]|nr:hypothetical protein [Alphaproteobacteria bacterium]MDA8030109.1 hypothetical protein [Alphaproteobacteria bacterium]